MKCVFLGLNKLWGKGVLAVIGFGMLSPSDSVGVSTKVVSNMLFDLPFMIFHPK